jgi:ABC-type transporter Mla subunit MlaD
MYADGGTLPISRTNVPVQFDDVFKTFDAKTRRANQLDLKGFGDTLTGRGSALNDTIHSLPELFLHLQPVARYLSTPSTGLTRFFDSLNTFFGAISPVAQTNSQLFTDMATTWEAVSRDPNALEQTIALSPSTEDVSTDSLRVQQPLLVDLTTFGQQLTPATQELAGALPQINPALEVGAKTLLRTPSLNSKLQEVMGALQSLAKSPSTNIALNALSATVGSLNPQIRYLGPYVTVCNYWNYFWTYLGEHLSERTQYGFAQRALLNFANNQTNSVGMQGATAPANGQGVPPNQQPEFVHGQPYGAAIDTAGNADCETGQRGYVKQLNHLDPQHRDLGSDPHTPGNQGTTWDGRARVPAGETFSRNPLTGFQLPLIAQNP